MSNIFTLDDAPTVDETPSAPATWQPGQNGTLGGLPKGNPTPAPTAKRAAKPKRTKRGVAENDDGITWVPLPAAKKVKELSPSAQRKAAKAQLIKEREADAAKMRINGVDGDVEIPKKPLITFFSGKRARPDEVAETLTDLASMLENGDSERRSVNALATQYSNYDIGQAYERVVMLLDRGVTLGAAMSDQEDAFPAVVRELIGAAKMPRDMHRNLRQAAVIIVEADNIKGQVRSALFKPGFMAFFLVAFIIAAMQFLLPMTAKMFTGIGAEAPAMTTIILGVGAWLKWVLLAILIIALFGGLAWKLALKTNERMAIRGDRLSLKAPLMGDILRMSVGARFCDVLSACLSVGMSELESLETASRACGNKAVAAWVMDHVGRQRAGIVTFGDVAKTELFPWNLRNRIETTTSLVRRVEILQELATTFHEKAQERLNRFAERVGPMTEGVVIVVVLVVVLLVISPIITFIPTLIDSVS